MKWVVDHFQISAQNIFFSNPSYAITARLAQSVERQALNLMVVGSSPTVGVLFFIQVLEVKNIQLFEVGRRIKKCQICQVFSLVWFRWRWSVVLSHGSAMAFFAADGWALRTKSYLCNFLLPTNWKHQSYCNFFNIC